MPFDAKVFRVMIASPSDVIRERGVIREVLAEWNAIHSAQRRTVFLPLGWESHASPDMGGRPQEIINKQVLKDADLLVGVFWTRIGTATGTHSSGTVEEIEEHLSSGKPAMLYFSSAPVVPDSVEPEQYAALKGFKDGCKSRGLFENYSDVSEFRNKFYRQVQLKLNQDDSFKVPLAIATTGVEFSNTLPGIPSLSKEAQIILREAAQAANGIIMVRVHLMGFNIQVNGKNLVNDNENKGRTRALWEGAIDELERLSLVTVSDSNRNVFRITREGYALADLLKS